MSERADTFAERESRLRALYEAKAREELRLADLEAPGSDRVRVSGQVPADVIVVKGRPGPAEAAGGPAMSGSDGEAALKALEGRGHVSPHVLFTLSRPDEAIPAEARSARLRLQIEASGAELVLAVDDVAAQDVADAFELASLKFGIAVRAMGRRLVAVDGLEASLQDPVRKKRVWRQFAAAGPLPEVF